MKYLAACGYIFFTAISFVFLDKIIAHIDQLVALSVMSICAIVVFNLLNYKRLIKTYLICWQHWYLFLIMSIALAIDWYTMVTSAQKSDPFVAMSALFIALSLVGFVKEFITKQRYSYLISCGLLIVAILVLLVAYQVPIGKSTSSGLIYGAIAGIAFYVYVYSSARLAIKANLQTIEILATRFWILLIFSLSLVKFDALLALQSNNLVRLVLVSFGALIIPIYCNQKSIEKLGANATAIFISLVPPVTYVFYVIVTGQISIVNTLVCVLISIALVVPKFMIR